MICGPKDPQLKFQPSIQSQNARIETRAEKYNGYDLRCVPSQPYFWFEQIYFELRAAILVVGPWDHKSSIFC